MDYSGIIENLKNLDLTKKNPNLTNGWSSITLLSAIAEAVYQPEYGWTSSACKALRERLVTMAADAAHLIGLKHMEAYVERLHEAATNHEDVTIDGVEYMPYPFDSDGMQLHIGDEVSWTGFPDEYGEVKTLHVNEDGKWDAGIYTFNDIPTRHYVGNLHHRSRKSVEDVLTELLDVVTGSDGNYGDIVEAYAKLLQIKEIDDD